MKENDKSISSLNTKLNLKKQFNDDLTIGVDVSNHLEKDNSFIKVKGIMGYKMMYANVGINTNFKEVNPILSLGIKKDVGKFNFDTSLNYDTKFRWLFSVRFNIF